MNRVIGFLLFWVGIGILICLVAPDRIQSVLLLEVHNGSMDFDEKL